MTRAFATARRLGAGLVVALTILSAPAEDAPHSKPTRAASDHWSLQPLKSTAELETLLNSQTRPRTEINPIDAFINLRLATNGLTLGAAADRLVLLRRLTFDLTGLPPTPQEIDAFVADPSPRAYDAVVERLLVSPRYGERWARHWLDVARYTESQGFEYDRLRENAWQYRDYVIRSFNDDKPYDQFMKEQIAGDVLEPITTNGIIASSLLVCGPWDEAGNSQANVTQKAITREEEMEDMLSVVGQTFLGLTVNCARCHDHKFDPIPQMDYYRLKSVFEGVKHGERTIADAAQLKAREEKTAALKAAIASAEETVARVEAEGWKTAAANRPPPAARPGPAAFLRWTFDSSSNALALPGELRGGARIENGRLHLPSPGAYFESSPLPHDLREKTLEAWVALDTRQQQGGAAISIETSDGGVFDAIVYGERQRAKWMAGSNGFERTRDLDAPEETAGPGVFIHLVIVYRSDNSIAVFRNGEAYGKPYTPASELRTYKKGAARILLGRRHTGGGNPFLTGEIKQAAVYDRALTPDEVAASYRASGLSIPQSEILQHLSVAQRQALDAGRDRLKSARNSLAAMPAFPVSYAGTRVQPEATRFLRRGDVRTPEKIVSPAALSALRELPCEFGLESGAPEALRRLKFAEWLTHPRNPLPARVMANRIWYLHFGQGLVATPNDFGVSGAAPTHPELLDWLAGKFKESGWSVKALHRLITMSAVYQQSSQPQARAMEIDADNQFYWRFAPRRLEAEAVRDAALAVSGQLNLQMGGPSVRPFDVLKFPANAYQPVDKVGPEFNRRSIYRMNVNSGKEPLLDAFDCPDPAVKSPRRGVTTTPLQALALMNNSFVQRQAGHLAERAIKESGNDLPRAIQTAWRLALGRLPSQTETHNALAVAGERSLTNVCWVLLNSTEFVYTQ